MQKLRSVDELEQLMLLYKRLTIAIEDATTELSNRLAIALTEVVSTSNVVASLQAFCMGEWAIVANARRHHTAALCAWLEPAERELFKPYRDALEASCAKLEGLLDKNGL
jgi:hypothetical protein